MTATYFISDLHLDPTRPDILARFGQFLNNIRHDANGLYILGDFVEYWIGDDDTEHGLDVSFEELKQFAGKVPTYLMHGNRDFLIGQDFVTRYQLTLLPDPTIINLYGQNTLLMHGDLLCTDDIKYQEFRKMVRNPNWQTEVLNKSLAERRALVEQLRAISKKETSGKAEDIMDVNNAAVTNALIQHNTAQLIHGHTHRAKIHNMNLPNMTATRIVLPDWYTSGGYLRVDASNGAVLHSL
ncbi:MAG: UDP-2,3-diacylglucosamine diphosphatase [Gammaproteobacteria bacterium]|nr:UDP-2,3-diacylglucosamine diphosphatase [Gammaproteobacteria bacterium]